MTYKILICRKNDVNNILVYENDELVEQYIEHKEKQRLEGNIYLGKVKNVLSGMQSAFIDIGEKNNALIHLKDIVKKESDITGNDKIDYSKYNINNYIKQNDDILVQIKKDSTKKKGARVTKDIKIVGRFLIILPFSKFITVSSKITDLKEKNDLKNNIEKIRKKLNIDFGIIARTSARNISENEIENELKSLIDVWNQILQKKGGAVGPSLLYSTNGLVGKLINDFSTYDLEVITNSEGIKEKYPETNVSIDESLDVEIEYKRKVGLKCGGFITIDETEALVAIDVNSGKFTGKKDAEENTYKINKEAVHEIAKQIRLQDLGGIIIIDFINMREIDNREKIKNFLEEEVKIDRTKVQIEEFTKLGLLELTRKSIYKK